jgi:hypothetical protein
VIDSINVKAARMMVQAFMMHITRCWYFTDVFAYSPWEYKIALPNQLPPYGHGHGPDDILFEAQYG